MTRRTRQVGTLVLTAAAIAYLVWKIDLGTTLDVLADTNLAWFALAVTIMVVTVPVLALRWGWLLAAHGIHERVPWLTRAYFVAYTAGQVLPTSLGGDAVRVVETDTAAPGPGDGRHRNRAARARARRRGHASRSARIGFLLSIGEFDVSAYLWLEGVFVFGTLVLGVPLLRALGPSAAAPDAAAARAVPAGEAAAALLRGHPPLPRPSGAAREGARRDLRRAGGADPRDLGGREGRRHRPRPAHLLRLRPAALPRDARAVHAERARGAGGVLRELPRERRRRREPGVRCRLPLLPRHAAARVPGRRDHAPRGAARRARAPRSSMADRRASPPSS